eukprot:GHVN01094126.1.p1 GENE.GHVN01094126.1~~GHVN01094126.1.p1  ORF type:complete len:177 (+),score=27.27 GHVN01094126.1:457-987(+)
MQDSLSAIESCLVPVIALCFGGCVGAGVDMITAADIRIGVKRAWFKVAEVEVGLAADLGTLQRFPRIVGNGSWVREVCLTGRRIEVEEALDFGLVSEVGETIEEAQDIAIKIASSIASKSPVAAQGTKAMLIKSLNMSTQEGLNLVSVWNSGMLQTEDMAAIHVNQSKTAPRFSRM